MAVSVYIDNEFELYQPVEEHDGARELCKRPAALIPTEDTGLLTVVSEEEQTAAIDGVPLARRPYSQEALDGFLQDAAPFSLVLEYRYLYDKLYDERDHCSDQSTEHFAPQPCELVIRDGRLFGFYYYFTPAGRYVPNGDAVPEVRLEGVFTLEGNWHGYTSFRLHDTDSFSDPTYYDEYATLSLTLERGGVPLHGMHRNTLD